MLLLYTFTPLPPTPDARKRALRAENIAQRKLRRTVRAADDPAAAAEDVDKEVQRIRKEASDAITALEVSKAVLTKTRHMV